MKRVFFSLILLIICMCGCTTVPTNTTATNVESGNEGCKYVIVDKNKQYVGNAYTTDFKWYFVLYNKEKGGYRVKSVPPETYYNFKVGDRIIFN